MVGKIIRDYIEGGARRLTVPGFGTFMRKDGAGEKPGGEVIFVELLRSDDGVLRELVEDFGHYSDVEAMALVDRFVFETRNAVARTGSATIEGLGTLTLDDKGVYRFEYSPRSRPTREKAVQEKLFAAGEEPARTDSAARLSGPTSGAMPPVSAVRRSSPARSQPASVASHRPAPKLPKKGGYTRSDIVFIVAVVAAAVAVAAMVFAFSVGNMPFLNR